MGRKSKPRLRLMRDRVSRARPRLDMPKMPDGFFGADDTKERKTLYRDRRWTQHVRPIILKNHPTCAFCGAPSVIAEHLIGHDDDHAQDAADAAGCTLPFAATWRERFWQGPFCGTCASCAGRKTVAERNGTLPQWLREQTLLSTGW